MIISIFEESSVISRIQATGGALKYLTLEIKATSKNLRKFNESKETPRKIFRNPRKRPKKSERTRGNPINFKILGKVMKSKKTLGNRRNQNDFC